jgi:hypothetical protein
MVHTWYEGELYGNQGIIYAWSTDFINWTQHTSLVLEPGTGWDKDEVTMPCVLILEDSSSYTAKMWYTGIEWSKSFFGIGLADSPWPCPPPVHISNDEPEPDIQLQLFPNPSSGALCLRYSIFDIRYPIFELYSIQGIKVRTLLTEIQQPGEYELKFDISDLPNGIYFVSLQFGEQLETVKLIKY